MRLKNTELKTLVLIALCNVLSLSVFSQKPEAAFTANITNGCSPLNVEFSNQSKNAISYYWDLGNGNISTVPNPTNVYLQSGNYTISLIVTSQSGEKDTLSLSNYIQITPNPVSDFSSNIQSACPGTGSIQFKNKTPNATEWIWDFGDGNISKDENPIHTYTSSGKFTVKLISMNSLGCKGIETKNQYIEIFEKPQINFTVDALSSCEPSHIFKFTNKTPDLTFCQWKFGDGNTSNATNPQYNYNKSGTFNVELICNNSKLCVDTFRTDNLITIYNPALNSIVADKTSGCSPLAVNFKIDTLNVKSVIWDFGDSTFSSKIFPTHEYNKPGTYHVSIKITTRDECEYTHIKSNYIKAGILMQSNFLASPETGCAPLEVKFTNLSMNSTNWLWDFGDGSTSNAKEPKHTFIKEGNYTVKLTSTNNTGCSNVFEMENAVKVKPAEADFNVNYTPSCAPASINFNNLSKNSISWLWDFGDGNTSNLKDPVHTYTLPGNYTVRLIAYGNTCSDTLTKNSVIQIINTNANYTVPASITGCAPYTVNLSDATPGAVSWHWDFGDGTYSSQQNINHTYTKNGTYIISLNINFNGNCTQSYPVFKKIIVKGENKGYSINTSACPPYISTFADSGFNTTKWKWIFGDGFTSTDKNPIHEYKNPGFYLVNVEIHDVDGCVNSVIIANPVGMKPCINGEVDTTLVIPTDETISKGTIFPGDYNNTDTTLNSSYFGPNVFGCSPLKVHFKSPIQHATSWIWDFGDGGSSTLENPMHVYSKPDTFIVKLIGFYVDGSSDTLLLSNRISVGGSFPAFSYSKISNCSEITLHFKDSSNNANLFFWNFGDGTSSTLQNPTHTYNGTDYNYTVVLTTSSTEGCISSASKSVFSGKNNPVVWADKNELCKDEKTFFNCSIDSYQKYEWDFGDGSTSNEMKPEHNYTKPGTYSVKLKVTDIDGCISNYNLNSDVVVYYPLADFTSSVSAVCNSLTVNFDNLSSGLASPLSTSCTWNFGDGSNKVVAGNTKHTYENAGIYEIELTAAINASCASVIKKSVKVYPKVYAHFGMVQDKTCFPIKVSLTDSSTSAAKWHWNFGDGTTSNLQNPVHTYNAMPDSSITLIITDNKGCTSKSGKQIISVYKTDIKISDKIGCKSLQIQFTDLTQGADKWTWDFGDGTKSTIQNPVHEYLKNGEYLVKLITSNQSGCKDSAKFSPIKINSPTADFTSPSPSNCSPSLVTFINNSSNTNTYFWDFGDGSYSCQKSPAHIYNVAGTYTVKLLVSNQDACYDSIVKKDYITVLGPIAKFSVPNHLWCLGKILQFTDSSKNALDWSWDFGDGTTSKLKNPTHLYENPGKYSVNLVVHGALGCTSTYSLPDKLDIGKMPTASFQLDVNQGCSPVIVSPVNNSINADTYLWVYGNQNTSEDKDPKLIFNTKGVYTLKLYTYTKNLCVDSIALGPITVEQSPVVEFDSYPPSGCSPLNLSLNEQVNEEVGATYSWKVGNYTSNNINPNIVISEPGVYNISLTVTNKNGCSDTLTKQNQLTVYDQLPPEVSPIQYVSVESDNSVQISWSPSKAEDFGAYLIYRRNLQNGNWEIIDSVLTVENSTYIDKNSNPVLQSMCYKIQTLDNCYNALSLDNSIEHCTVNVSASGMAKSIIVSWTPYKGAIPAYYELYRQKSGEVPVLISKVTNKLEYMDEGYECPEYFSYRIKACELNNENVYSLSDTSIARSQISAFEQIQIPVERSTVSEDKYILTEWRIPYNFKKEITSIKIYRSTDTKKFELITDLPPQAESYLDMDVNVKNQAYQYKIQAINSCGLKTSNAREGSSILLKAKLDEEEGAVDLEWSSYENWENDVEYYIIEKKNDKGEWNFLRKVDKNTLKIKDK